MELKDKLSFISTFIAKQPWFDFEILEMNGGDLTIIGSDDFSYHHLLEITFHDVFHMSLNREWKSDTRNAVLLIEDEEATKLNIKFQVEQGNFVFKFVPEDFDVPFYIVAQDVSFNTDKVYYYKKENLQIGERIADWVS